MRVTSKCLAAQVGGPHGFEVGLEQLRIVAELLARAVAKLFRVARRGHGTVDGVQRDDVLVPRMSFHVLC